MGGLGSAVRDNDMHGLLRRCSSYFPDQFHLLGNIYNRSIVSFGRNCIALCANRGKCYRIKAVYQLSNLIFSYFVQVLMAVGITAAVCLALTIFALQTKVDFTMMGGILLACMVVFMIFGIVAIFFKGKIITLVYASIGALLFSVYLIYDTQLMMGGDHKYSISPEEYIFAALNLYLDIVNIFIYILTIIGASRD